MSALADAIASYKETKKKFQDEIKDKMKLAFKEFFDANPEVEEMTWVQYTPWFNDGDTCEFSVNDIVIPVYLNDDEREEAEDCHYYDLEGFQIDNYYKERLTDAEEVFGADRAKELATAIKEFRSDFHSIPEEVMEGVFNNHVKVTATREGFEVEEYEHD